jgi:FAD/FMN-containing dehydrogenase
MTDLIEGALRELSGQLGGRVSRPGDPRYAATAIWAKPVGRMPRTVVHCQTLPDIQLAIAAARSAGLSLSVRGGGHDWAGRALCDGLVLDLSGMRDVVVNPNRRSARISGGARASDVLAATDPLGLAAVTGSCSAVGLTGLTLGGGYGPLIGRFGLALDNLIAADVVLADGRIVIAEPGREEDLLWALRGGGGNFGVVTEMRVRLHELPNVVSGVLVYPFSEAKTVLRRYADAALSMPDELTVQVGAVAGPDRLPVILLVPTWCGSQGHGDAHIAPLLELGICLRNPWHQRSAAAPAAMALARTPRHRKNPCGGERSGEGDRGRISGSSRHH